MRDAMIRQIRRLALEAAILLIVAYAGWSAGGYHWTH
jgi:hypothetical protein